jgi:hypothetical protein
MGGLIVQRALLDDPGVANRVRHLFLFGTPSNGLKKASSLSRWLGPLLGEQIHNLAADGDFIRSLREDWRKAFGRQPPFQLHVIAGDKDQFVPPESSLEPFDRRYWNVIIGDHLSMVKPKNKDAEAVRLTLTALREPGEASAFDDVARVTRVISSPLRLASEAGPAAPEGMRIAERAAAGETKLSEEEVVDAALALDRDNKREQAIALLERHQDLGTDVKGTLAGRIKRRWLQGGNIADAKLALEIYSSALATAQAGNDDEQIYYHAINAAFLEFAAFDHPDRARDLAQLATAYSSRCEQAKGPDIWTVSTKAEANLYLDDIDKAIAGYRAAAGMQAESWKLLSTAQQAQSVAAKLRDERLKKALHDIFDPKPAGSGIFVSYSHRDKESLDEFELVLKPYLKQEDRLRMWNDKQIQAGTNWLQTIRSELAGSNVAVLLVSAEFLASDFIAKEELPVILEASSRARMKVFWILLSPAAYDATPLQTIQAAHDISKPLKSLTEVDRRQVLLDIARKVKSAVYA